MLKFPKKILIRRVFLSKFKKMEVNFYLKEKIIPYKMREMVLSIASNGLLAFFKVLHSNVND